MIVYVRVGDQAENYHPQGQTLTVNKGDAVPEAKTAIRNANELPSDAQYEWAFGPDTNTSGTQSCLVKVTYPDNSVDYVPVNVTVKDSTKDNVKYPVKYAPIGIPRPTGSTPKVASADPKFTPGMPDGTIIGYHQGNYPAWQGVETSVKPANDSADPGRLVVRVHNNAKIGTFNVPIEVSYQDGTTAIVYVPVSITGDEVDPGGDHIYYGNQSQTIMKAVPTDVHKTSVDYTPDATKSGFNEIIYNYDWDGTSGNGNYRQHTTYKLSADGKKFVNVDNANDIFAASKISYIWMDDWLHTKY